MKNESKNACINDQSSCIITSERIGEENTAQIPHAKRLKDTTSEQRKKEASKPIYLVRYE
jgi:hypothetical protein